MYSLYTNSNLNPTLKARIMLTAAFAVCAISGAVIGALLFSPGIVNAQNNGDGSSSESSESSADNGDDTSDSNSGSSSADEAAAKKKRFHREVHLHRKRHHLFAPQLDELAELAGTSPELAREALKSGKSWSDIATENGIDPQILIDAHVALISEQLTAKVSDGLIDQDTADGILAIVKAKAADFINGEHRAKGEALKGWHHGGHPKFKDSGAYRFKKFKGYKSGSPEDWPLACDESETSSETKNVVAA